MNNQHKHHITLTKNDGTDGTHASPWRECSKEEHAKMFNEGKTESYAWTIFERIVDCPGGFDILEDSPTLQAALERLEGCGFFECYVGPDASEARGWIFNTQGEILEHREDANIDSNEQ